MFSPSRVRLARKRRGLTKVQLAEHCGVSVRSVTAWEAGDGLPSEANCRCLAGILGFSEAFFAAPEVDEVLPEAASFRALSTITARLRDQALATAVLACSLFDWMEQRFQLPKPDLPDLVGWEPATAAAALRQQLLLGERPVSNTIHMVESRGVRVFSLTGDTRDVDAFSFWRDGTPFISLNTVKSAEHSRFDVVHELGHLVLHRGEQTIGNRRFEREAHAFAAAFLMPATAINAAASRLPRLDMVLRDKQSWGVSAMAYVHRLHALGLLSDWHYRAFCIELSKQGYRRSEPGGMPRESSQLLDKVFSMLRDRGFTTADIANELYLSSSDFERLIFGLVMLPVEGEGKVSGRRASHLRAVE